MRLVAKVFSQKQGVHYHQISAPTAKQVCARVILHLTATIDGEIHAMCVDQAFRHGDLQETIYMEVPEGLPDSRAGSADLVWRMQRPLHGLKEESREWHAKLKESLLKMGFKPSTADPSLFLGHSTTGQWIVAYVDDLLIMEPNQETLTAIKTDLSSHFPRKDLGPVTQYLGMQFVRDREAKKISLHQRKQVDQILYKVSYCNIKEFPTLLELNHGLLVVTDDEESCPYQDRYPELVGFLMYIMVCTRPDFAQTLSGGQVCGSREKQCQALASFPPSSGLSETHTRTALDTWG